MLADYGVRGLHAVLEELVALEAQDGGRIKLASASGQHVSVTNMLWAIVRYLLYCPSQTAFRCLVAETVRP